MRRNARALVSISLLVLLAGLLLGFQTFTIGDTKFGDDTPLGLKLGLDLQGGTHLVYQAQPVIDTSTGEERAPNRDDMEGIQRIILRRVNASGLGEPKIQLLGEDRLLIQLPGVQDPGRAKSIIGETARLEFKHRRFNVPRDLEQEGVIVPADIVSVTAADLNVLLKELEAAEADESEAEATEGEESVEDVVELAEGEVLVPFGEGGTEEDVEPLPVLVVEFTDAGAVKFQEVIDGLILSISQLESQFDLPNRLEISLEGAETLRWEQIGPFIQRVGETSKFAIPFPPSLRGAEHSHEPNVEPGHVEPDEPELTMELAQATVGENATVHFTEMLAYSDEDFGLSGDNLTRAYPSLNATTDQPIINIEFDAVGTRLFGELTTEIAGKRDHAIAIFLDGEELIAPVVTSPITSGTAIIQGRDFTIEEVRDKSFLLEGGRLPVPIKLIQERDIDAILGADSLAKSVVAGGVGMALVFLFIAFYYRLPGLIAALALVIYAVLVLAVYKLTVTLTLSGVAATILSVGMAVDANILIFERMKDELRNGRTLISAINIGFNRAWPAIRDSNVSTLITCAILYYFSNQLGTTIVQGFAFTLAIGVMISMFSAIVVTRTILRVVAATPLATHLGWFVPYGGSELPQNRPAATALQRS
ncbi:MAG: protein translocase subunit SecD [Chloroflexi bacterium]|nr:protein translocase subunit SecD [Chloroflexota bacterium]